MKKKAQKSLHKEFVRFGSKNIDFHNLRPHEAISISIVFILAVLIGTIYGCYLA